MSELTRFGVAMNTRLLDEFDRAIDRRGYANRSEALRDLVRSVLVDEEWQDDDAEVAGTVTLVYDHEVGQASHALMHIQHDNLVSVVSTLHVHLNERNCLEVVVLRGQARDVRRVADALISLKGIKLGRLTAATVGAKLP